MEKLLSCQFSGTTKDGFLLSGAIKFESVRSSYGNLRLFEISRATVLFSRKFNFSYSSLHHIFESETFRCPLSTKISLTWRVKYKNSSSENCAEFCSWASKIIPEWNAHLEIISRIQAIENSRKYFLLQRDSRHYRKQSLGVPDSLIPESFYVIWCNVFTCF